ncbi:MAG: hypothetical protein WD885_00230 [Candidatus Saccharimonadales bacterium]
MSRGLLITGFGSGKGNAETIAEALSPSYFEEIDALTFSEAVKYPERVRKAAQGATAVTHSAGFMALKNALVLGGRPERIHAIGAPIPSSAAMLMLKTLHKSGRMLTPGVGAYNTADIVSALRFHQSAIGELGAHMVANFGQLGRISRFDAVQASIDTVWSGVRVDLGYNDDDAYFQLSQQAESLAVSRSVPVHRLPGEHDEIILRPELAAATYFDKAG